MDFKLANNYSSSENKAVDCSSLVGCLPSMHEALNLLAHNEMKKQRKMPEN